MELLDESQKKLYNKCKYKVKVWEHKFQKANGRLPSKLDIKDAEAEVREAYKTYFNLKTSALEQSFVGVDGFHSDEEKSSKEVETTTKVPSGTADVDSVIPESTWGLHLNNVPEKKEDKPTHQPLKMNLQITKKLSFGSKIIKRNPRKSLSQVKSEPNIRTDKNNEGSAGKVLSFSQPVNSTNSSSELEIQTSQSFKMFPETKVVQMNKFIPSQSINIFPRIMNQSKEINTNIDINWLERAENSTKLKEPESLVTKTHCISDEDIIDKSDDESVENSYHIAKKMRCSSMKISVNKKTEIKPKEIVTPLQENNKDTSDLCDNSKSIEAPTVKEVNDQIENNVSTINEKKINPKNSENFVRINLKKKVYVRGKKTQTFSKYKKKMWKDRKKMLAENDDEIPENGKFRGKFQGDKLLPLDSFSDPDDLITINEASEVITQQTQPHITTESDEDDLPLAQIKDRVSTKSTQKVTEPKIIKKPKKRKQSTTSKKTAGTEKKVVKTKSKQVETHDSLPDMSHLFNPDEDMDLLMETLRIEESMKFEKVQPLYESMNETLEEVFEALNLFGFKDFRYGQEKAVMRILSGKSTLVTLSTGSGKSLCYQLPAYLYRKKYRNCITLVVSPLISLMEDQLKCIPGVLNAACLHSNQTKVQRDKITTMVKAGEISVLMVSPESILSSENSSGFGSILAQLPPIAFACLDEAHCLSQWSHNFRPSYLVVCRILQETFGVKTILGLTATATKKTELSIIDQLKISDGQDGVIKDIPVPSNLNLSVSSDANKDQALLELLNSKPFVDFRSIIIYCLRREECEKVAAFLRTTLNSINDRLNKRKRMSLQAEAYHAGMSGAKRKSVQKAFMSGELRIVVATIAFGMGINKSDLRSVIHYRMPGKFESYVQEIGRAGRDGLPAHCHVFLAKQNMDVFELRRHIYSNSIDRHIIRKLLRKVFVSCNCENECFKHEVMFSVESTVRALDIPQEIISTLLCYLELHEKNYIKILRPSYAKCKILSYGGRALIEKLAMTCEPLKTALKMYGSDDEKSNCLEFPIINVARTLNHDSGICKRILKNLEWTNINGQPKRSGLTVTFYDLSFHLLSPGNLPDEKLDEVLNLIHDKVLEQENTAYSQLIHINNKLSQVACSTFKDALSNNQEKSEILKENIRDYFESNASLEWVKSPEISENDELCLASDIRSIIGRYSDENFTGRSIARIFHGIGSPNFPPLTWGKTKYWRSYLHIHFNTICRIATSELIKNQIQ